MLSFFTDILITVPKFIEPSYITYPPLTQELLSSELNIRLRLYPTSSNGLILFTSRSDVDFSNYLSLSLFNGYFQVYCAYGFGRNTFRSSYTVNINTWYLVNIILTRSSVTLTTEGQGTDVLETDTQFSVLDVQSNLFIGGYSSFVNISSLTGTTQGFMGSISQLEINDENLDLIVDADFGFGIAQSNVSVCAGNPCLNDGECIEIGPSFVCNCSTEFTGILCGSREDPCIVGATLCASDSTCQTASDGLSFECICPINRGGEFCDESE